MKIAIGSDHTGFELKKDIIEYLVRNGIEYVDTSNEYDANDDYPDIAFKTANKVVDKECEKGIVICGSGIGIGISANKVRGIRCGTCNDVYLAKMSRLDNDANMIALGARVIDSKQAEEILDVWLNTEFLGNTEERHLRRVNKIMDLENK